MKPESITVLIHTHNEEKNIRECIDSAKNLSDTIIVVDMESTDKTIEIAKQEKVKVKTFPFSHYVEPARAFGINLVKTEWVFILDADERMTDKLAQEIKYIVKTQSSETHFKVPRKNIFGKKKWLKHGGWWPDYQMRFLKKKAFKKWPKRIHSTPIIEGAMGLLNNPILHYFHGDIGHMVNKTMVFEDIESELLFEAERPVYTLTFFRKFFGELFRRLILNKGFMDGTIGIIESFYQAYSKTITYLFLYEKYHNKREKSGSV